jgi:hypothetical protein
MLARQTQGLAQRLLKGAARRGYFHLRMTNDDCETNSMPAHTQFRTTKHALALLLLFAVACVSTGCQAMRPKQVVDWSPDQAVLPTADFYGNMLTVHNIRNCEYRTEQDYTVHHYDKTFDLNKIKEVDFIVVPFPEDPALAHTMLSFGFEDDQYVGVSIEVRKRKGQTYDPVQGMLNEYQLMYVVGDEHDLIGLRTNYRKNDVYMYPTKATPEQTRALFVDIMKRADKLAKEPEYYHTITNNCTTNIARHINDIAPGKIQYDYRVLINGYSDQLAYDLGLIDTSLPFEQVRERARITNAAYVARESPDFSKEIRRF